MKASGDSKGALPLPPPDAKRRRRRILCILLCLLTVALLAAAALALALALTVFKIRDPKFEIASASVDGVSPRVTFPALKIELNLTLDLAVRVRNPNYAAFSHASGGRTRLLYRGVQIGEADVAPGRIPARGSAMLRLLLAVEMDKISAQLGPLVEDVLAGAVAFDTETRLPGRVTILGFLKHHAVATSACHVVFGVSDLKVHSQECKQSTKL